MKKISVMNYKGGTGKTSTVVNLGHGLALKGQRVLIVDTDPQGSTGQYLGVKSEVSLYDVLLDKAHWSQCVVHARANLDVIVSNERVYPAELLIAKMKSKEHILSQRLETLSGYDVVLVDCAPSMNLLNQNALLFAQNVMLPVSMEYLSLVGVRQLLNNIKIINKIFKKSVTISKVIPTFFDKRNKKSLEILESLNRVFPGLVCTPIRSSVSLSEAPGFKKTIFEYDPNSNGAQDYYKLIQEVLDNGETKTI